MELPNRKILHIDCNKFYASVECLYHPELRDKPVAVGGSEENRHGIVLTKNEIAAQYGVQTGEPLWQAREKCRGLVVVPPNFALYTKFSKRTREIYRRYTDFVEPFSLDECWLEFDPMEKSSLCDIGFEIKELVKEELGITVSVGASFNKVFAKLGSDYKKPDALTEISQENYKNIVWPLPVRALLFVGSATEAKLNAYGIFKIGDLAGSDPAFLRRLLGKNGLMLYRFANGLDDTPVRHKDDLPPPKSISNSTTTPRDLVTVTDLKIVLTQLCESVCTRLRAQKLTCSTVSISVRDKELHTCSSQMKTKHPTCLSRDVIECAFALIGKCFDGTPVRSLGVSVTDLEKNAVLQYDLVGEVLKSERTEKLETTVDELKKRFGSQCVRRAATLFDKRLGALQATDVPCNFDKRSLSE